MKRNLLKQKMEFLNSIKPEFRTDKMHYAIQKSGFRYRPFEKEFENERQILQEAFLKKEKIKADVIAQLEANMAGDDKNAAEKAKAEKGEIDKKFQNYLESSKEFKAFMDEELEFEFYKIDFDDAFFQDGKEVLNYKLIGDLIDDIISE